MDNNHNLNLDDVHGYSFNHGDCDIYALALHRLYKHPLYAIRGKFLEPAWGGKREWDYEYCHIMVKLPNGNYLDCDGEQTEEELIPLALFAEKVKKVEFVEVTVEEAQNMFSCLDQENHIQTVMKLITLKKQHYGCKI